MMTGLFTMLLISSVYMILGHAHQSELRLWVLREQGNRFLSLDLANYSAGANVTSENHLRSIIDEGSQTNDHQCISVVRYDFTQGSDLTLEFENTVQTVDDVMPEPRTPKTRSTCIVHWEGEGEPPAVVDGPADKPERLNWWIGKGTDIDSKPLFKGLDITCSGDEDLRSV